MDWWWVKLVIRNKIMREVLRPCCSSFPRVRDAFIRSVRLEGVVVVLRGDPAHRRFRGVVIVSSLDESLEVEGAFKPSVVKFLRMA
jgi:hypothetical protein